MAVHGWRDRSASPAELVALYPVIEAVADRLLTEAALFADLAGSLEMPAHGPSWGS